MVSTKITKDKQGRIKISLPARCRDRLAEKGIILNSKDEVDVMIVRGKIVITPRKKDIKKGDRIKV